jgi:hypothetical protein
MGGLQPPLCNMSLIESRERVPVPSCHGGVPNRHASMALDSAITIAIRNSKQRTAG